MKQKFIFLTGGAKRITEGADFFAYISRGFRLLGGEAGRPVKLRYVLRSINADFAD